MKKSFFLQRIIALVLLLAMLPVSAFAIESHEEAEVIHEGRGLSFASSKVLLADSDSSSLDALLYEGIAAMEDVIDISGFGLRTDAAYKLSEALDRVINNNPDLFYLSHEFQYGSRNGAILSFYPIYTLTEEEVPAAKEVCDAAIEGILGLIDSGWSDLEKVMFISDHLVSHYEYDIDEKIRDIYHFFESGTGVCQAYYLACRALLDACNIPSHYGMSQNAMHIWNIVQIDGQWYHLDVTHQDPTEDLIGASRHDYFLVSTKTLLEQDPKRSDWSSDRQLSCTDTTYDQYYWKDIEAPFVYIDGMWYYSDIDGIHQTTDMKAEGEVMINHKTWPVIGFPSKYWIGAFSGLGAYHGWLIYNTADQVIGYHTKAGESCVVYTYPTKDRNIYSILVDNDSVISELSVARRDGNSILKTASLGILDEIIPPADDGEDDEEPEIGKFDVAGVNMTLGNELLMNFMVKTSDLGDGTYTAKITHSGNVTEQTFRRYNGTYHNVAYSVSAKQMADDITVEVFDEDGNAVSNVYTRSVRAYAMDTLAKNYSDETNTLLVDMLNYGAAAQEFFGYNEEDLANSQLTRAQKNMATELQTCKDRRAKGKNYYGSNLSLEDQILLNLYFENVTSDMYAKITFTDFRGRTQKITVNYDAFKRLKGNIYGVVVDDIVLGDSFCDVTVTVYKANGKTHGTATDSVESYCARQNPNGEEQLYNTIMQFAAGAKAYLS